MNQERAAEFTAFHTWARNNEFSYTLSFSDCDGFWEVEITSQAPSENAYMKRCHSLKYFVENYQNYRTSEEEV